MTDIKVGDVVRLKSGGPYMTVMGIDNAGDNVFTQWFDGCTLLEDQFVPESLTAKQHGFDCNLTVSVDDSDTRVLVDEICRALSTRRRFS